MPAQIDWKAEDERSWGEIEPENGPAPGGRRPLRRLRLFLLALIVAAGLAGVAYWQVNRFLDSSADEVEEGVLDGHALVLEAAARRDGDLIRDLILSQLQEWTDARVLLAEEGLWLDRRPLDLYLAAGVTPTASEVILDPGLSQAEVTTSVAYRVGVDDPGADTVRLRQTYSYRYQDGRWMLNPPIGDFWGSREATSGRYLTLSYPERDVEVGRRLAADLEAALSQTCNSVAMMRCDPELHMVVDLVADPAVLVELSEPVWQLAGGRDVTLPTPTLTGLPEDEAAYRALYRGYASRVVARLIAQQTLLAETRQPLLALALSGRILQGLGLQTGTAASGPIIYDGRAMAGRLESIWNGDTPLAEQLAQGDAQTVELLVDFLTTAWSEAPETEMLRQLAGAGSWQEWLERLSPEESSSAFADAWQRYMIDTYPPAATKARPGEVVLLLCDQALIGSASLCRYDPVAAIIAKRSPMLGAPAGP